MHETDPPCERCHPGIDENNLDVWKIFNLIGFEGGVIPTLAVLEVSRLLPAYDEAEVLMKITDLVQTIRSLREN